MYLLTNVITMLMIPMQQLQLPCSEDTNAHAQLIPRGSINEYTIENGVQFNSRSILCI